MKLAWLGFFAGSLVGCNSAPSGSGWSAARFPGDTPWRSSEPLRQALGGAPQAVGNVLYVNFAGEYLQNASSDDATKNASALLGSAAQIPPLNAKIDAPKRTLQQVTDAIFDRLRGYYLPYDVTLTRTRPAAGTPF